MEEILQEILLELKEINSKLDNIQGDGTHNSISDVCNKLDSIQGNGIHNSISDICDKMYVIN